MKADAGRGRAGYFGIALLVGITPWIAALAPRGAAAVLAVATLVALGGYVWHSRRFPQLSQAILFGWAGASSLVLASALWCPDIGHGLDFALKASLTGLQAMLVYAIARDLPDAGGLDRILIGAFGGGLALAFLHTLADGPIYRLLNPGIAPGDLNTAINRQVVTLSLMALPAAACLQALIRNTGGWIAAALLLVATFTVGMTSFSQSGPAGLLIGVAVVALTWAAPRTSLWLLALVGIAAILLMPFGLIALSAQDGVRSFDWEEAAVAQRLDIWIAVAHKVMEAPWLGHGIEAARFIEDWSTTTEHVNRTNFHHPHNAALQIWLEFGALGAGLAALAWAAICLPLARWTQRPQAVAAGTLAATFVVAMISYGLWQSWWLAVFATLPVIFIFLPGRNPGRAP